jgi:hypothetical protein
MSQERIIAEIGGFNRMRSDLVSAITRLTLQIKAIGRRIDKQVKASGHFLSDTQNTFAGSSDEGGGQRRFGAHSAVAPSHQEGDEIALFIDLVTTPLSEARKGLITHRNKIDRHLTKLVTQLEIWPWAEAIKGVGALSITQIVGEAGDLSRYGNPAKVWKTFGLHVIDGGAARPKAGVQMNYSPRRRAVMHVVGECLIKQNGDGVYKTLYDERKDYEILKAPELKPFMHHKRAMRYMEKRFLRDLWRQWNKNPPIT